MELLNGNPTQKGFYGNNNYDPLLLAYFLRPSELRRTGSGVSDAFCGLRKSLPKGSVQLHGIYRGLKGVPMSLLWGLCMYFNDAWTLGVKVSGMDLGCVGHGLLSREVGAHSWPRGSAGRNPRGDRWAVHPSRGALPVELLGGSGDLVRSLAVGLGTGVKRDTQWNAEHPSWGKHWVSFLCAPIGADPDCFAGHSTSCPWVSCGTKRKPHVLRSARCRDQLQEPHCGASVVAVRTNDASRDVALAINLSKHGHLGLCFFAACVLVSVSFLGPHYLSFLFLLLLLQFNSTVKPVSSWG